MAGKLQKVEDAPVDQAGIEEIVIGSGDTGDLNEMFADLEAGLGDSLVVNGMKAGNPVEVANEDQLMEAGRAANNEELKAKALEELNANSSHHPENAKLPEAQGKKAPATKRISTAGMAKSEALATALGDKLDDLLTTDTDHLKLDDDTRFAKRLDLLENIDKMPKKIGEKATNLFAHVAKGAALSNYTRIAVDFLVANGEMTSKQLKDAYMARPYSDGTSSSQTTQMMNLLPALGIASKEGNKLVVNANSTLLPLLTVKAA